MKKIRLWSVILLSIFYLNPLLSVVAQSSSQDGVVNISPIEQIEADFDLMESGETEETVEEITESVVSESEVPEEVSEETSDTEENKESISDFDPEIPHTLVEALQQNREHSTSDLTLFENVTEDEFYEKTRAYIRDESIYYMILIEGAALPEMYLLSTENESIQHSYVAIEDLMSMTAELLNTDPEAYAGTVVEEFYLASQDNAETFMGKFVENTEQKSEAYEAEFIETIALDELLLTVIAEWLQNEAVQGTGLPVDDGVVFGLDETTEPIFTELFDQYSQDYPELERISAMFSTGFQGNIALNFELMELGVGLVGEGGGVQYFLRLEEFEIPEPTKEQLYSVDEFNELVGFDVMEDLDQVRQEMVPSAE